MDQSDLLALCERAFNQAGITYARSEDDGSFVVAVEGDGRVHLSASAATAEGEGEIPLLTFELPLLVDVQAGDVNYEVLTDTSFRTQFGSLLFDQESGYLLLGHLVVGWPGTAELHTTIELLIASSDQVMEYLDGRIAGNAPPSYSEVVE